MSFQDFTYIFPKLLVKDDLGNQDEVRKILFFGLLRILTAKDKEKYDREKINNFLQHQMRDLVK